MRKQLAICLSFVYLLEVDKLSTSKLVNQICLLLRFHN